MTDNKFMLQDRQCMYKVTLRRVRPTIVTAEKHCVYHNLNVCICSLTYAACNVLAPDCHVCAAPLKKKFCNFSHKGHEFLKKKIIDQKCIFKFSTQMCMKHLPF